MVEPRDDCGRLRAVRKLNFLHLCPIERAIVADKVIFARYADRIFVARSRYLGRYRGQLAPAVVIRRALHCDRRALPLGRCRTCRQRDQGRTGQDDQHYANRM